MANTLEELAALTPGWDSYKAKPINPCAIETARLVLATQGQSRATMAASISCGS